MEHLDMSCQLCLASFTRVGDFKTHLYTKAHRQNLKNIFGQDFVCGSGKFPNVVVLNHGSTCDVRVPIIGLSMYFSREQYATFYLCHFCEEKYHSSKIISHLCSNYHYSNYFNQTNPNALSYSWLPSLKIKDMLRTEVTLKLKDRRRVQLQVLDLPGELVQRLHSCTYSEVMNIFSENEQLLKQLEAAKPERTTIQSYLKDQNREHPLLGMQHLVECVCVGQTEKRFYLCTLCHLTLSSRAIIKHILSFDHIHCYFKAYHPSTLLARESYMEYDKPFASGMLDFAKQSEKIHGTAHCNMKQMSLEPEEFKKINSSCYEKALKELESIRKENKESSLITSIIPGKKLAPYTVSYKLHCQNCRESLPSIGAYCRHVSTTQHKLMLTKSFGEKDGSDLAGRKPILGIYKLLNESLKINKQPLIGVPLVVTCVSTGLQQKPLYVCFACQESFPESSLRQHFDSQKHLIQTLLYQNPWRLTFAWENPLDVNVLRSMAWEEERERGPNQMLLKVLYIPNGLFQSLKTFDYLKVMEGHEPHHTLLKHNVPMCETYSRLQNNERFPLLGSQFLVTYSTVLRGHQASGVGFLCMLCERMLSDDESYTHVFSREHVAAFLDCFHPGSLNSSTDAKSILDLAKQAAHIHPISHVQVVKLGKPIWKPCFYSTALSILTSANKREKKATLKPTIVPQMKLVPRESLKEEDKDNVSNNIQESSKMKEGCEETTSQKSTGNSETTLEKTSVEVGAEVSTTNCIERGENAEKGDDKEKESEKRKEVLSGTTSQEIKNAGGEVIKEVKIDEPTAGGVETPESCQNTDNKDVGKDVLTQLTQKLSQEDTDPVQGVKEEMSPKRQLIVYKEDASCEEPQNLPSREQKEGTTADNGSDKTNQETATCKASSKVNHQQADQLWQYVKRKSREPVLGLSALVECHCDEQDPVYLCECCSLKISEKDIVSHVTGVPHQWLYLQRLQKLPPRMQQGPTVREFAVLFEQQNGFGEAQVVELDDESFQKILKQSFTSAKQTVKALQDQQASGHPSTSAHQEEEMEIDDDSKGSESQISSDQKINTAKVHAESKDVKLMKVKVSADNAGTCPTASRSTEDKAEIISNTVVGSLKTISKTEGASETAAAVTTPTISMTDKSSSLTPGATKPKLNSPPISKLVAAASACTAADSKLRETAATVSTCTASTSCASTTSTTESATLPKLPESRTGAAATVSVTSRKAVTASDTETTVAVCRAAPASRVENASSHPANASKTVVTPVATAEMTETRVKSRNSEVGNSSKMSAHASRMIATPVATAHMTEKPAKCRNTEAAVETALMENSVASTAVVAPYIYKSKLPAAPHKTTYRPPTTEPSRSGIKRKHSESPVGLSQLIKVKCDEKKQVYCQMCSVRLLGSSHVTSYTHQYNYVKMKFPELKQSEVQSRLPMLVAELASNVEDVRTQKVNVDEYKELAALPEDKALERLKAMERRRARRISSSSPNSIAEAPFEASSPVYAVKMKKPQGCAHPGLPVISIGKSTEGPSNLSRYLKVKGLDDEPVLGLGFVWECRSVAGGSFYLCESCSETLPRQNICQHMVSLDHQHKFICMRHPHFLYFMDEKSLEKWMTLFIIKGIAELLSKRECYMEVDAQGVLLGPEMYETVRTAPFCEALKIVQDIKKKKKVNVSCPLIRTPQQDNKNQQSPEESVPMKVQLQPAQALETNQRRDNRERQNTEKQHLEESVGDDLRRDLNVSVVAAFSGAGTTLRHQEQPEPKPPVSQHQWPIPVLKQAEVCSESPSSGPNTRETLPVSPTDHCPPTRKRPAVDSVDTLVMSCTNNQHEDPLSVKYRKLQPISDSASKSASVSPAANFIPLFPTDNDTGAGSDEQGIPVQVDQSKCDKLIALLRKLRSELNMSSSLSAPDNDQTINYCTEDSSERVAERKLDPQPVPTSFTTTRKQRWDSKFRSVKNPPLAMSVEEVFATAAPEVPCHENQLVMPNANTNTVINNNAGQIAQPRDSTETDSTEVCQLPINPIISVRPSPPNQWFMSVCQEHNEVQRGDQFARSSPTAATVSPSQASGHYSQLAYATNRQSHCFSSEAVGHYTTPVNPPVYAGNSYQWFSAGGLYPYQVYPQQEASASVIWTLFGNSADPRVGETGNVSPVALTAAALMDQRSRAAGNGSMINGTPFMTLPNSSQSRLI